jgi:hypothetical protein
MFAAVYLGLPIRQIYCLAFEWFMFTTRSTYTSMDFLDEITRSIRSNERPALEQVFAFRCR